MAGGQESRGADVSESIGEIREGIAALRTRLVLAEAERDEYRARLDAVRARRTTEGREWTNEELSEALDLWDAENSALRRNLAWIAGQPGTPPQLVRDLARRINTWGQDSEVPPDCAEDEAADQLRFRRAVSKLTDLVREAIEAILPEAPPDTPARAGSYDEGRPGTVRNGWTLKADALLEVILPYTIEQMEPRTLAEVRDLDK